MSQDSGSKCLWIWVWLECQLLPHPQTSIEEIGWDEASVSVSLFPSSEVAQVGAVLDNETMKGPRP